jgi:hypothetical protein
MRALQGRNSLCRPFQGFVLFLPPTQGFSGFAASPWALLSRAFSAGIPDPVIVKAIQLQVIQSDATGGVANL